MEQPSFEELLQAGVHFGHLKRKWNPNMAPYIFMERNGIHIIDLHKTSAKLEEACNALKQIAYSGKRILFVATKKQARNIVTETIKETGMPFITERWTGGMLTNFVTIRKAVRKMELIDKLLADKEASNLSKKEKLTLARQRAKLEKNLGSIADLTRLPAALFIVDIHKEHIAIQEAKRLNIPTFAMVDTNSDPRLVDFAIPSNDDASISIEKILSYVAASITEGLKERQGMKDKAKEAKDTKDKEAKEADEAKVVSDKLAKEAKDNEAKKAKEEATATAASPAEETK
jgi:small subunit ribosomal protein S2|tara:strand:- start:6142 stop:7005 length:864 start_codon:yes stop_codon:yes gene_type:complete